MFRISLEFSERAPASAGGPALWRQTADSYVRSCLANETTPRVKDLAGKLRLSRPQLSRAFLSSTGMPLSTFFALTQLEEIKRLLAETDLPVAVLSNRSGFENVRTFERFFVQRAS